MRVTKNTEINRSAADVWKVLAIDFAKADLWMSSVPRSYEKLEGKRADGSDMVGRICELTDRHDGPYADETITEIDHNKRVLRLKVVPMNGKLPVEQNLGTISVKALTESSCLVIWDNEVSLKTKGKMLYPMLKIGLGKNFTDLLEELKYYVENGEPHPRKVAKIKSSAA